MAQELFKSKELTTSNRNTAYFWAKAREDGFSFEGDTEAFCSLTPPKQVQQNSCFVKWRWNGSSLTVEGDRYGIYPIWVYLTKDEICISSSINLILKKCSVKELNYEALGVFLRIGYFLNEETPFKNVYALKPNSIIKWGKEGYTWTADSWKVPAVSKLSPKAAAEELDERLVLSVGLCSTDKKIVLPLSGGRDSRHILFALDRLGRKPDSCVTFEQFDLRSQEDVRVASELTKLLNIRHIILKQEKSFLACEKAKNLLTGFCTDEGAQILTLSNYFESLPAIATFDGIAGDVFCALKIFRSNPDRAKLWMAGKYGDVAKGLLSQKEVFLKEVLAKDFYERISLKNAEEKLRLELEKYDGAPNPIGSFYFWNRTRREIALSFALFPSVVDVFTPFLDSTVMQFLESIPISFTQDGQFHTNLIFERYQPYAHIGFERPDRFSESRSRKCKQAILRDLFVGLISQGRKSKFLNINAKTLIKLGLSSVSSHLAEKNWWYNPVGIIYLLQLEKSLVKTGNAGKFYGS